MADTDVLGILSLLLAAGGAAYLYRGRLLALAGKQPAASDEDPISEPPSEAPDTLASATDKKKKLAEEEDDDDEDEDEKKSDPPPPPKSEVKEVEKPKDLPREDDPPPPKKKDEPAPAPPPPAPAPAVAAKEAKEETPKPPPSSKNLFKVDSSKTGKSAPITPPAPTTPAATPPMPPPPSVPAPIPIGPVSKPKPSSPNPVSSPGPVSSKKVPVAPPVSTKQPVVPVATKTEPLPNLSSKPPERTSGPPSHPGRRHPTLISPNTISPFTERVKPTTAVRVSPSTPPPAVESKRPEPKKTPLNMPAPPRNAPPILNPPPKPLVSAPPPDDDDEVPKLDVEEDEDVQPTKFGKLLRKEIQPAVDKIVFDEAADGEVPAAAPKFGLYAIGQTDPGKRRKQNEDAFAMVEEKGVFIVADGMGGHRGGQMASKLAVKTVETAFKESKFEASAHENIALPASELARSIQMANTAIIDEANRRPELKGMGTTICAARFTDDNRRLYVGHVGDSRCYRLRDGVMKQMTTDHTMSDYGVAGPEGAHLARALGVWPTIPIDIVIATPQLGDVYLLCSDGLTKMLADGTIATQLLHEENPKAALSRLIFFANAHGGKDNITVVLIRIVEPGWKPPKEE